MRPILRKAAVMLLASLCFTLSGCAAFQEHNVPDVTDMPSVTQYQHKPKVYFDVRFFHGQPDVAGSNPTPQPTGNIESAVDRAAASSGLFSSYSFDEANKTDADYTIQMYYYDYGSQVGAFISGFISGFSLGIIPGAGTDHYALRAMVVAKDGSVLQNLSSEDSVTLWTGIWFIPMMGNTPQKVTDHTLSNMALAAFKQMVVTKQLKYSELDVPRTRF
jgi:hypothetical protein